MAALSAHVARNMAAERVRRSWTQQELAERLDVTRGAVSGWETGARVIGLDMLGPICRALNITLADLFRGADPVDRDSFGLKIPGADDW